MKPVICIAGPTASGKSAYAVQIARALDGEIINADALQVYSDLQILSARPTTADIADVPHHLFGHVSGDIRYSTGKWLREVEPLIFDILSRRKAPVLVGGTGLYFRALLQGLADIPSVTEQVIQDTSERLASGGIDKLRAEAEQLDPAAVSRVLGNDPQRLQRIVNVAIGTGRPLSIWQAETHPIVPLRFARFCVLTPPREKLYARIDSRYDKMLREGGMAEAKAVFAKGFDESLPIMKAIGLRQLQSHLRGNGTFEDAIDDAKRESRRFAKRQMTWFRNQPPKGEMLTSQQERADFLSQLEGVEF